MKFDWPKLSIVAIAAGLVAGGVWCQAAGRLAPELAAPLFALAVLLVGALKPYLLPAEPPPTKDPPP